MSIPIIPVQKDITIKELREFIDVQVEDELLFSEPECTQAEHLQKHIRLLHNVIIGELNMHDASRELQRLLDS